MGKIFVAVLKTIAALLLLLVAGGVIFRQGEIVSTIVNFYTNFSLQSMLALILAGFGAGFYFVAKIDKIAENVNKKKEEKTEEKK